MKECKNPLIPEITRTYKKRMYSLSLLKLPEGLKKKCVWCIEPLKGRQRRWCSDECVNSATAWAYPQKEHALGVLLIRQNFKCQACQFDWGAIIEAMYLRPRIPYGISVAKDNWRTTFCYSLVHKLKDEMHLNNKSHRVEIDHIVPISKGGVSLGLDNHRALCYDCHKIKTKQDLSGKRPK